MINFKNVSFEYEGGADNIRDLNLHSNEGEVVLLCGESGCGKSTLIRMINGLIPNYYKGKMTGCVTVNGLDTQKTMLHDLAPFVASVFQNPKTQFYNIDSTEEMVFSLENRGVSRDDMRKRLERTVDKFRMEYLLGRNLFKMSGGEKRLVSIATILAMEPDCILMDEPEAALDPRNRRRLIELLKTLKPAKLIASHDLDLILDTCDRVILMSHGRIVADGLAQEILRDEKLLVEHDLELPLRLQPFDR